LKFMNGLIIELYFWYSMQLIGIFITVYATLQKCRIYNLNRKLDNDQI